MKKLFLILPVAAVSLVFTPCNEKDTKEPENSGETKSSETSGGGPEASESAEITDANVVLKTSKGI